MQYNRADGSEFQLEVKFENKIQNDEKRKSRRTKNDQQGRNFACPCGKSYLSYPALYTHVKTKHQGRSGFLDLKMDKQMSGISSKGSDKSQKKSKKYLASLSKLLNSHFNSQNLNVIYEQGISPEIIAFVKSLVEKNEENSQKTKNYNKSVCEMMCKLLSQIQGYVNNQAFSYLKHLFYQLSLFIAIMNQQNSRQQKIQKSTEDWLQDVEIQIKKMQCNELPNYFNKFILAKKPPHIEQQNTNLKASLVLGCKVLLQLGMWMEEEGYTRYSIKLNSPQRKEEC